MSDSTFLLSSFHDNPEFLFDGYCFVDNDYIFGEGGAKRYISETGNKIEGGEDGCYVVAYSRKDEYTISCDYAGYKKILYYYDPLLKAWAVSNSLSILIDHLKKNGVLVTPNLSQLYFHAQVKDMFGQQLSSFSTIANNIMLLPTCCNLIISRKGMRIENIETLDEAKGMSYQDILSKFISVWSARFENIFSNKDITIRQALTGGLDSRAMFSLTNLARKKVDLAKHSFVCIKIKGDSSDLEVAEKITNYYGYSLNDNVLNQGRYFLNGEDTYKKWKNLSLGLYFPMYFDAKCINPLYINVNGGGGGRHKPVYQVGNELDFKSFTTIKVSKIDCLASQLDVRNQVVNSMNYLMNRNKEINPFSLSFIEFRSRMHAGLFPQSIVDLSPLNSYLLDPIAKRFQNKIADGQLLYDLINLDKDALNFDFDESSKEPTRKNLDSLTSFNESFEKRKKGQMYIDNDYLNNQAKYSESYDNSHIDFLRKDLDKALSNSFVKSIWQKSFIERVRLSADSFYKSGRIPHATAGIEMSCLLASSMFYD